MPRRHTDDTPELSGFSYIWGYKSAKRPLEAGVCLGRRLPESFGPCGPIVPGLAVPGRRSLDPERPCALVDWGYLGHCWERNRWRQTAQYQNCTGGRLGSRGYRAPSRMGCLQCSTFGDFEGDVVIGRQGTAARGVGSRAER